MKLDKIVLVLLFVAVIGLVHVFPAASAQENFRVLASGNYIDSSGYYHIVGEIENTSGNLARLVKITALLYDEDNTIVGSTFDYATIDLTRPGEKSSFHLIFTNSEQIGEIEAYRLTIDSTRTLTDKPRNLELEVGDAHVDAVGYYHLVGEVKNNGDRTATFVEVSAVFYDRDGNVVDTAFGYTAPDRIPSGDMASFELVSTAPNASLISTSSVNADSVQFANIPEFPIHVFALLAVIMCGVIVSTRLGWRM